MSRREEEPLPREDSVVEAVNRARAARGDAPITRTPSFYKKPSAEAQKEIERLLDETIKGPSGKGGRDGS